MKRSRSLFAAALALGLAAAAQSRADTIPIVSFQWLSVNPQTINASRLADPGNPNGGWVTDDGLNGHPTGNNITFTGLPSSISTIGGSVAGSSTDTSAANIIDVSTAPPSNPDTIGQAAPGGNVAAPGGNYAAVLQVSNTTGGKTLIADVTINGLLKGTLVGAFLDPSSGTQLSPVASLKNAIESISYVVKDGNTVVSSGTGSSSGLTFTVGDASVTIDNPSFSSVEPSEQTFGGLSFTVSVAAKGGGGGIQGGATPEPSGVVLGCLGLSCLGGVFWRARRRKAAAALRAAV